MAKEKKEESQDEGNLLAMLMSQASGLDFTDPDSKDAEKDKEYDPRRLIVEGFEVSKLFAVIEFAFLHAKDEDGILAGLDMMSREEAVKSFRGVFCFIVTNAAGGKQEFLVEMRKKGTFYLGKGPPKTKPDVTITVSDKDMVSLSTGKLNPQMAFLKGKIKAKGNLMLGLRCQSMLQKEVAKMSRL